MSTRYLILPTLLLTAALLSNCDEDSFSQVAKIDLPDHESRPVLTLSLVAGDTSLPAGILSLSRGILDETSPDLGMGGNLRLLRNGQEIFNNNDAELRRDETYRNFYYALDEPIDSLPADYELVGDVEGFGSVSARQRMPAAPDFTLLDYDPEGGVDVDGFRVAEARIRLSDPPGEENYYYFQVISPEIRSCDTVRCDTVFSDRTFNTQFISSPDPNLLTAYPGSLALTDDSFDGEDYTVRLQFNDYSRGSYRVDVWSLTEDGYRYLISRDAYENSRDNPFAEPVNVHQNVTDGFGLFQASNRRSVIVR